MLKRVSLAVICLSWLTYTAPAAAQEHATLVLHSGERISGELLDMGGAGFALRVGAALGVAVGVLDPAGRCVEQLRGAGGELGKPPAQRVTFDLKLISKLARAAVRGTQGEPYDQAPHDQATSADRCEYERSFH